MIEDSLKALKSKQTQQTNPFFTKPNPIENCDDHNKNEIPQYFDLFDKPNKHYRSLFKPNIISHENEEIDEIPKVHFSTPQELRQTKKIKLLNDLNFTISKLKSNEETQLSESLAKKVRFVDHPPHNTSPKSNGHSIKLIRALPNINKNTDEEKDDGFIACPEGCGRRFAPSILSRHTKICKNVFLSKKDPFDMSKHRKLKESKDIENRSKLQVQEVRLLAERLEMMKKEKESQEKEKNQPENFPKWKKQSEALRAVMKDTKGNYKKYDAEFIREGLNKHKYVKCEGCGRMFTENAAERHVSGCLDRVINVKLHKRKMII